tara:strand:+ start:1377 stop:3053 length:1677 start_codon:yes stop_codon:yes gene_type:complete
MKIFISTVTCLLFIYGCQTSEYYNSSLTGPGSKVSTHENPNQKDLEADEESKANDEITASELIQGKNLSKIAIQTKKAMEVSMEIGPKTSDNNDGMDSRRVVIQEYILPDNYDQLIDQGKYNSFLVSINFQNTEMKTVIQTFAEITGENILVGDEVEGTVTANIQSEPWMSALEAILDMKEMDIIIDPETNLMRVHSRSVIQGSEGYEKAKLESLKAKMAAKKSLKPKRSEMFKLYYVKPAYMKERLIEILQAGLASGGGEGQTITSSDVAIAADTQQNSLIINATKDDLDLIERVIDEIDVKVDQILIEAIIIEASDNFDEQLGARLGFSYTQPVAGNTGLQTITGIGTASGGTSNLGDVDGTLGLNTSTAPTAGDAGNISDFGIAGTSGVGLIYDIGITALKGEIFAMQSESLAKVMSNPKVFTLNGIEAKILKGKQIQFTSNEGEMQFKEAGLKLTVLPHIVGDGNVILELAITNDEVVGTGSNPQISKMEINTNLIVANGSVVAIGGIYTQTESVGASKVPILGDIPVLGRLFRTDAINDSQTQVIIFIAPKVV